jgi:hypothetical protein
MKANKLKFLVGTLVVLATTSCEKDLELVNPNAQTAQSFWKTSSDAAMGVNAAYSSLITDGTYMRFTPLLQNVPGDDVRSNSPWGAMAGAAKFSLGTADMAGYGWSWETYYQGVNRCNQVIDNVPNIEMNADTKKVILGQAHFLRGLYFFHLVNFFGNVTLPLHEPKSSADFLQPQRTEAEGWAQIIADFNTAIPMLPVAYTDAADKGRATKGAAMAYMAKALLFTKKYAEASAQFKAVIDLNVYDLMSNYKDNFTTNFENNKESIFEVQFSATPGVGGTVDAWGGAPSPTWARASARAITFAPRNFGWVDVQPTFSVLTAFQQEKTTTNALDPRLDATIFYNYPGARIYGQLFTEVYKNDASQLNDIYCKKYQNGDGNKVNEFDWKSGINERIYRYADVLLMYAECQNELGNRAEAAKFIQRVRTRAGLPNRELEFAGFSQAQIRDQLGHERLLEFCLEGHRFDDIKRWGWLKDATKLAWLKARDPEMATYQDGREYFPIPQHEIDNNPGFKQNKTY